MPPNNLLTWFKFLYVDQFHVSVNTSPSQQELQLNSMCEKLQGIALSNVDKHQVKFVAYLVEEILKAIGVYMERISQASGFNVSVLLNAHNEMLFIEKTLLSLKLDMEIARENKLRVELVVVLDNSSDEFYHHACLVLKKIRMEARVFRVNYGSLGASRNFGVDQCSGEYVCVADADDLISSNCLTQMYKTIKKYNDIGEEVAVFPEFVWNFGENDFVTQKFESNYYQLKDWAYFHPFCSKMMIKRSIFKIRGYQSYDKYSPFAYEDWEFNAYLLSKGIKLVVAPNVILFYRQHPHSMMKMSSGKFIPKLDVLSPSVYMKAGPAKNLEKNRIQIDINTLNKLAKEAKAIESKISLLCSSKQIYPQLASVQKANWTECLELAFGLTGSISFDSVFVIRDSDLKSKDVHTLLISKLKQLKGMKLVICLDLREKNKTTLYELMELDCVVILDFANFFSWMRFENRKNLLCCVLMSICKNGSLIFISERMNNLFDMSVLSAADKKVVREWSNVSCSYDLFSTNVVPPYLENIFKFLFPEHDTPLHASSKDIQNC